MTRLFESVGQGITRRWLMKAGLATSLVSLWSPPSEASQIGAALRRVFSRPESARAVGAAVLRNRAGPVAAEDLLAELKQHRRALCDACGVVSRDRLAAMLREASRDDFERGCTQIVDGWILGRTEALVCALVAVA